MKQKMCMFSSLFLRKSSDGQSWSELRAGLVLDRWPVTFPTPIPIQDFENRLFCSMGADFRPRMDVGVTFGLRLPLGQHPVPLCLRTKDAIPFRREGRREVMMKLRDLEKREEKKNSSEN